MSRSSLNTSPGLARGWRRADVAPPPAVRQPDLLRWAARCRGRCHVTLAPYKTTMSKVGTGTSLAPTLLLSMPQLDDPNFKQTVVLLCEHGADGAFGLVLNRQTETPASSVVRLTPPVDSDNGLQLWIGGPVEPERGWILMGQEPDEAESVEVCDGLYLSTSPDLLRRVLSDQPPSRTRLLTGYAGWGAGQLDEELSSSSWLIAEVELDLIFETQSTQMWETAIRRLGAEPSMLQMGRGIH